MGRIFNDFSNSQAENVYAGSPVEEVKALNKEQSEQYNKNIENKDSLDLMMNNLDLRDVDYSIKKQAIENAKNQFAELVKNGNYQDGNRVIQKVHNDLLTNNALKDAIDSRAREKTYYSTQKERLDKGEISQEDYNIGLLKTKHDNTKGLEYDPNTMTSKNKFSGQFIHNDMSDEIAKDTMDAIKDWKATGEASFVDNKGTSHHYQVKNIGGVENVYDNGEKVDYDEVANALKSHIESQEKYKDYINQKLNFRKYVLTTDADTGVKRDINRNDLDFLSNNEIKKGFLNGISEEQISQLEKSKNIKDNSLAKQLRLKEAQFNINDPKQLEQVYNKYNKESLLNDMVHGASEKASYTKFTPTLFKDDAALEELKFKHNKALEGYKRILSNQGVPLAINKGDVKNYTGDDYNKVQDNINNFKSDLDNKKALLSKVNPSDPLYRTRVHDVDEAQNNLLQAQSHIQTFYDNLSNTAKSDLSDRITSFFTEPDHTSNWDYRISKDKLQNLMDVARTSKDYQLYGKLSTIKDHLEAGDEPTKEMVQQVSKGLVDSKYLPILSEADDERVKRSTFDSSKSNSGFPHKESYIGAINSVIDNPSWYNRIGNIMQKEYNTNDNIKTIPDVVSIAEQKDNPNAEQYHNLARTILSNSTDVFDDSGNSLDKILSNKTDNLFYTMEKIGDKAGKLVKSIPDMSKTVVSLALGSSDGKPRFVANFKDKDGNDLMYGKDDGKAEKTGIYLRTSSNEDTKMLYNTAAQYADGIGEKDKAIALRGEANFGENIRPLRIGGSSLEKPLTLTYPNGKELKINLIPTSKDASKVIDVSTGKQLFNGEEFRSKSALIEALEKSYEYGQ